MSLISGNSNKYSGLDHTLEDSLVVALVAFVLASGLDHTFNQDVVRLRGTIVMNDEERMELVKHYKWVDEVVCSCPWSMKPELCRKMNIHYVTHDYIPYTMGNDGKGDVYFDIKKQGFWKTTQKLKVYQLLM